MSSNAEIVVRVAGPSDAELLVAFGRAMALETEGLALDEGTLRRGVYAVFESADRGFYAIAEAQGEPAGALMITYEWSDWRNAWWWWIQSVYVRPEFRKRGVYRALHDWVAREARQRRGVCGLRLYVDHHNAAAQHVYARMGMKRSRYDFFEQTFSKEAQGPSLRAPIDSPQ